MLGYSNQVTPRPVVFENGLVVTLADVDGNAHIGFPSGIYLTTLRYCHPKVSEAVAFHANNPMNSHDFNTAVKVAMLEKLAESQPWDLAGMQLYDTGATAVEAILRVYRAAMPKSEFISCYVDFREKTGHAVSFGNMNRTNGEGRSQGFYMVLGPDRYRPLFTKADGAVDTDGYY